MRRIFNTTLALSDILQCKGLDLAKACTLVDVTIKQLEDIKNEEVFLKLYSEAENFTAEVLDIEIQPPMPKRVRKLPQHLCDSIVYENTGAGSSLTSNVKAQQEYKEVVDKIYCNSRPDLVDYKTESTHQSLVFIGDLAIGKQTLFIFAACSHMCYLLCPCSVIKMASSSN